MTCDKVSLDVTQVCQSFDPAGFFINFSWDCLQTGLVVERAVTRATNIVADNGSTCSAKIDSTG